MSALIQDKNARCAHAWYHAPITFNQVQFTSAASHSACQSSVSCFQFFRDAVGGWEPIPAGDVTPIKEAIQGKGNPCLAICWHRLDERTLSAFTITRLYCLSFRLFRCRCGPLLLEGKERSKSSKNLDRWQELSAFWMYRIRSYITKDIYQDHSRC